MKLDINNLSKTEKAHGLNQEEINRKADFISEYIKRIEKKDQGFYKIIDQEKIVDEIEDFVEKNRTKYKNIVVLGIGGSALGTISLKQSLKHIFVDIKRDKNFPSLHVLDNIDPVLISSIEEIIKFDKTLFIVVSKSGSTPETITQYFYFLEKIKTYNLKPKDHFVFITDPEKGLLRKISKEEGIFAFDLPENVVGRFSVLTTVSLLPAKLIGIDIKKLIKGAQDMRDQFLSEDMEKNTPFQIATVQYLLAKKGKLINVVMPYSQKLIRFADWYRQLLAESIGKAKNEKGEIVNVGLTPINALGVTDQHSQLQLYNEGPNDKFFIFIKVNDHEKKLDIPNPYPDEESLKFLHSTSFNELIKIEMEATLEALTRNHRPNITIEIDKMNEEALGNLFMLFEGATAFLGEFLGINAFNQPGVELSKKLTKEKLLNKK